MTVRRSTLRQALSLSSRAGESKRLLEILKNPKGSGSNAFKRTEYGLIGNEMFFLVHYIGDEAAFENIPHGNAKKSGKKLC